MWTKEATNGLIIFIVIILGCILLFNHACGTTITDFNKLSQNEQNYDIYSMAQDCVKNNLKSPSTAKFPGISEVQILNLGNNEYEVNSYVDAENSFGAMLRNNFDVKLKIQDEKNSNNTYTYSIESCNISQ